MTRAILGDFTGPACGEAEEVPTSCTKLEIGGGCCGRGLVKLWWERCGRGLRVQRCCWQFWLDDANIHPIPIYTLHQGFPCSGVWTSTPLAQF